MGSSSASRLLGAPTRIVLLSLLMGDGSAQSAVAPDLEPLSDRGSFAALRAQIERAEQQAELIRVEESREGPLSPELIDEIVTLGLMYHEIGNYDLAVETLERALQVHRVNFGLSSLGQVPMLRHLIAVHQTRGNWAAVRDLQNRMIRLALADERDIGTVPLLTEAAEREMNVYRRHLAGELPAQVSINIGFGGASPRAPPPGRFALAQAQRFYTQAIRVSLQSGDYRYDQLRELEKALIESYYLELTAENTSNHAVLHHRGREAHRRLIAYTGIGGGAKVTDYAAALVELADWDLMFSQNGRAIAQYREAYDLLAQHGEADEIERLFRPDTPVAIPANLPSPLNVDTRPSDRYVEIVFDVSRFGRSRRVTPADPEAGPAAKEGMRTVARTRFRPMFHDGDPVRASEQVLRYRY